jgi:hypothetical protein
LHYKPQFDLALRAICYRGIFGAPSRFASRRRHGTRSEVAVRVTVLPDDVLLHLEHHYASGHAWMIDDDRPRVDEPLAAVLSPEQCTEVATLQADESRWTPEVLLGLFAAMTDTGGNPVPPAEADFFELGQSVTFDGRLPMQTLRLGRTHDEIVLDHGMSWPSRERQLTERTRLEPPGTPAALRAIEAVFGPQMARSAALFHTTRERRFV